LNEADINSIIQLISQGVFSVVFIWLYFLERKAHDETRKALYEVLKEVAGLRVSLVRKED
jgi:hypothetical protein